MPISKQQICMLQAGDVISVDSSSGDRCFIAVLEHDGSKLVLSSPARKMKDIPNHRISQWEYLIVDDEGNVCDKDGRTNVRQLFDHGTVLLGRAIDLAHQYRTRIKPNTKIVREGDILFFVDSERRGAVERMIADIRALVFNNDYDYNIAMMSEMFVRLVQGVPSQELPIYLTKLLANLSAFSRIQEEETIRSMVNDIFFSDDDAPIGKEAQKVIDLLKNTRS